MTIVIKRDGREELYNPLKIKNALIKAFKAVDETSELSEQNNEIIDRILNAINGIKNDKVPVEEIQDIIENKLMQSSRKDVAKAYILYRQLRSMARSQYNDLMNAISDKLFAKDIQNQNANVDEASFGGRMGEANDVVMKKYALDYCVSEKARRNHLNNRIYIHDLNSYAAGSHNCLSVPFDDLLANGFNTRQTDVRGAQSINTAFQLVAVIFQIQSLQQFGGVSATHLDWTMVPYVRKSFFKHYVVSYLKNTPDFIGLDLMGMLFDDYKDEAGIVRNRFDDWVDQNKKTFLKKFNLAMDDFRFDNRENLDPVHYQSALYDTIIETKQAVEGMFHNLNTLQSRSGNQLPFSSINYGTCTSQEGRLITRSLLQASIDGTGRLHKTSIFPCGIFQCMKGVNRKPGEPNYDLFRLALRSTAQRLYPNYVNVDWSGNVGYDINNPCTYMSAMGCRTANGWDVNGFGQLKDGRGNICPVTIILPTLAMEAKNIWEQDVANKESLVEIFMSILDKAIYDAKDMLLERFDWICSQSPDSAKFMYENRLMAGYIPEEGIRSALRHGTLACGQLGLAEALQILIGCDHTEKSGMELAKKIEALFKKRCTEFKEEYKLNFGVYYSPAENLCHTALKKFKETYGVIPNVSDKEFFTNSMHVPVWKEMSPFKKIDIESQLTGYSSAGCITYVELDSTVKNNIDSLETLVNYAMDKDIPYFAINVPNDTCLECGYCDEFNDHCPQCDSENIQQLRRVTGYLTGNYTTAFNKGKQQEVEMRVKHK